jgi:hypothetical protein
VNDLDIGTIRTIENPPLTPPYFQENSESLQLPSHSGPTCPITPPVDDRFGASPRKRRRLDNADIWDAVEEHVDRNGDLNTYLGEEVENICAGADTDIALAWDIQDEADSSLSFGHDQDSVDPRLVFLDGNDCLQNVEFFYNFDWEEAPEDEVCFGMVS